MDLENAIIKELSSKTSELLMSKSIECVSKKEDISIQARELGNQAFRARSHDANQHEKILNCYSASLALAPNDSEHLAFAYSNKSALLLHLKKFEDCIKDVDRALKLAITPNTLRVKLLCRKLKCFVATGKLEGREEILEEINKYLTISDDSKSKKALENLVNKVKTSMNKEKFEVSSNIYETENSQVYASKESKDIFHHISISHSAKDGHHLTATEDIHPGQLIFVSKPYVTVPNFKEFQSYCAHCVNVLWSSVPCQNCGFSLYCSEECRDQAKKSYHELECRCLQLILCDGLLDHQIHLAFRTVILAVKELGSIEALIELVRDVDGLSNDEDRGFYNDGKFDENSFRSFFKFTNTAVEPAVLDCLVAASCRSVIALARYTSFFGDAQQFKQVNDLLNNANVLFIATLLLRISLIVLKKGRKIKEGSTPCENSKDQVACHSSAPCCERGFSINMMNIFIPHSCNPNVRTIMVKGGKELCYALQPIKKGQPLLHCYKAPFFEMDKPQRSFMIAETLGQACDCIACEENWPSLLAPGGRVMTYQEMSRIMFEGIKNQSICEKLPIMIGENERYTQATVDELIKVMSAIFEVENQPSKLLCSMISILCLVIDRLHGIKLYMPNECRVLQS